MHPLMKYRVYYTSSPPSLSLPHDIRAFYRLIYSARNLICNYYSQQRAHASSLSLLTGIPRLSVVYRVTA